MLMADHTFHNLRDFYDGGHTEFPNRLFGTFPPIQTATYLQIRRYNHMDDGARPPVDTVADAVGKPRRTVERAIRALVEDQKEIRREPRGHRRPCRYHFAQVLDANGLELFTRVPNWTLRRRLSPAALTVYVTLLEVREVPKLLRIQDIADKCRIHKATVRKALDELASRRLITVTANERDPSKRHRYTVLPRAMSRNSASDNASDMRGSRVTVSSSELTVAGSEMTVTGSEMTDSVVPRWRTNKTLLQKDSQEEHSPQEHSSNRNTRPHTPGSAGVQTTTVKRSQGDGQEREGVRERLQRLEREKKLTVLAEPGPEVSEAEASYVKGPLTVGASVIKTVFDDDGEIVEDHAGRKGSLYLPPELARDDQEQFDSPLTPSLADPLARLTGLTSKAASEPQLATWSAEPWEVRRWRASRLRSDMNASALVVA